MTLKKTVIRSFGTYLPSRILSNSDLETMVDTSDEWIKSRTGMHERRIASESEPPSFMGIQAALKAIEKAAIDPKDIDIIITTTLTPDSFCPPTATIIQHGIGAVHAAAFDLSAACSGYLFGLATAKSFLESGSAKTVLLVSTEKNSTFVDYTDRNTCVLFGDGAGACVLTLGGKGLYVRSVDIGSDGSEGHLIQIPAGGAKLPASHETIDQRQHYIKMNGREVFKHAVRKMEQSAKQSLAKAHLEEKDLRWLIPHQANMRIIEALSERFDIPKDRVVITLDKLGNTSSSTIPIALDQVISTGKIASGDLILLCAFGGGLTWGSAILEATSHS